MCRPVCLALALMPKPRMQRGLVPVPGHPLAAPVAQRAAQAPAGMRGQGARAGDTCTCWVGTRGGHVARELRPQQGQAPCSSSGTCPRGLGLFCDFPPCRCLFPPFRQPQERAVTRGPPSCPLGSPRLHQGDRGRWQGQGTVPAVMGRGDLGAHISSARSRNGANKGCGAPRPCWGPAGPTLLGGTQGVRSLLQTAHHLRLARSSGSHGNKEEVYRTSSSLEMLHRDAQHFFSSPRTRGIRCKESRKQEESKGWCGCIVLLVLKSLLSSEKKY